MTKYEGAEVRLSYALFEVAWGRREDETGCRVYKADQRDISQPKYKLFPTGDDPSQVGNDPIALQSA